jgi:hypothetical protein
MQSGYSYSYNKSGFPATGDQPLPPAVKQTVAAEAAEAASRTF